MQKDDYANVYLFTYTRSFLIVWIEEMFKENKCCKQGRQGINCTCKDLIDTSLNEIIKEIIIFY